MFSLFLSRANNHILSSDMVYTEQYIGILSVCVHVCVCEDKKTRSDMFIHSSQAFQQYVNKPKIPEL